MIIVIYWHSDVHLLVQSWGVLCLVFGMKPGPVRWQSFFGFDESIEWYHRSHRFQWQNYLILIRSTVVRSCVFYQCFRVFLFVFEWVDEGQVGPIDSLCYVWGPKYTVGSRNALASCIANMHAALVWSHHGESLQDCDILIISCRFSKEIWMEAPQSNRYCFKEFWPSLCGLLPKTARACAAWDWNCMVQMVCETRLFTPK